MAGEKKKILIVDDSITMRQLVKMMLKKNLQCDVTEAKDGLEAIEKYTAGGFDLVVTDINMPRMDGLGLVRHLRQDKSDKVPIIIVTTRGSEKDRDTGMELGANAYVAKPINGARLAETARKVLDGGESDG